MSNSVQSHRWQPTRLSCPWDSPGKNTGVSCHFLRQCMNVKSESEVAQSCLTLCHPMDCSPPGSSVHGIFQARVLEWVAIAFSLSSYRNCERQRRDLPSSITAYFYQPVQFLCCLWAVAFLVCDLQMGGFCHWILHCSQAVFSALDHSHGELCL